MNQSIKIYFVFCLLFLNSYYLKSQNFDSENITSQFYTLSDNSNLEDTKAAFLNNSKNQNKTFVIEFYNSSLLKASKAKNNIDVVVSYYNLGLIYYQSGDWANAILNLNNCITSCNSANCTDVKHSAIYLLGLINGLQGNFSVAFDNLNKAKDYFTKKKNKRGKC